jgi:hypothetical protein
MSRQPPNRDTRLAWYAWAPATALAIILVVPRVARFVHPDLWTEDSVYLYHAFALLSGERPFVDGIYVHPPFLEAFLALLFRIFGVSYRVAEIVSALVIVGAGWLLYDVARRLTDRWVALVAPATLCLAPLLVRYHVFEREVFTLALATLGFWIVQTRAPRRGAALAAGAAAGAAMAIKLSGAIVLPPLLAVYLARRQLSLALWCGVGALAVGGGAWASVLLAYGHEAFLQLVVLHSIDRGVAAPVRNLLIIFLGLGYVLLIGAAGLADVLRRDWRGLPLAAAFLAVEVLAFYTLLSGTIWPHNLIELLLPLSIGMAFAAQRVEAWLGRGRRGLATAVVLLALTLDFALPGSWSAVKGDWGYVPREAVTEAATFLRENVPETAPIAAPHYLATQARRRKLIHYRELRGPVDWMRKTLEREGYAGLDRHVKLGHWMQMVDSTSGPWRKQVEAAIRSRALGAIVTDRVSLEWEFVEAIRLPPRERDRLYADAGYRLAYESEHYRIWLPDPPRSTPPPG